MYAIFESGGKQHRVTEGEEIALEKLDGEAGAKVTFDQVLLVNTGKDTKIGTPTVSGAKVAGTVVSQFRGGKITIYKKKRRKGYRRKQGHRQSLTRVRIESISG